MEDIKDNDKASELAITEVSAAEESELPESECSQAEISEITSEVLSPAPSLTEDDNHSDSNDTDEAQVSFFSISSKEFDESCAKEAKTEQIPYIQEHDDGAEITPPDELFAYRSKPQESEELPDDEEEQIISENPASDGEEEEEADSIDDDGQYQFSDLEPVPPPKKEKNETEFDKYDPKKPRKIDGRFDLVELFVFTLLAVMILTTFFFRHSIVDGASMENTLHSGEHLIISDFFYTPKRGDIIVCEDYSTNLKKPIVKRVIAIEGDVITLIPKPQDLYNRKLVYVNGELLDEDDYVFLDGFDYTKPVTLTVPKDELFVMGDHRNDSEDSRSIGTISEDSVLGKVILRFYPFNKFGPVN